MRFEKCISQGKTEAENNIRSAIRECLEARAEKGLAINCKCCLNYRSTERVKKMDKLKLILISELAPLKEHIKLYEQTKGCKFQEFEERIKTQDENFSDWDDYIEWKAYQLKIEEIEKKIMELEKVSHVEVTE